MVLCDWQIGDAIWLAGREGEILCGRILSTCASRLVCGCWSIHHPPSQGSIKQNHFDMELL